VFLILHREGVLPGVFALPAGWGDIAIGTTAPLVAWAISSKKNFPKQIFVLWNVLGMLDLVMAVSLGILASASPLGILAGEITTRVMGTFPLSLIPTFFVPLLMILHLIALGRVRHEMIRYWNSEDSPSLGVESRSAVSGARGRQPKKHFFAPCSDILQRIY